MYTAQIDKILVLPNKWAVDTDSYGHFKVETRTFNSEPWSVCKGEYSMQGPYNPHEVVCDISTIARYIRLSEASGHGLYLTDVKVLGRPIDQGTS